MKEKISIYIKMEGISKDRVHIIASTKSSSDRAIDLLAETLYKIKNNESNNGSDMVENISRTLATIQKLLDSYQKIAE